MTPRALNSVRQIIGLESLSRSACKQRRLHIVAASLGNDVHHEACGFRLTQSTGHGESHFLRLSRVHVVDRGRVAAGGLPTVNPSSRSRPSC